MAHPAPFAVRQQLHYDITTMDVGTGSQVTRAVNINNTKRLRKAKYLWQGQKRSVSPNTTHPLRTEDLVIRKGNGQKQELPVDSWPETGGQKYEGSKHSIWAHVIGQHHLPPVSGCTPTGTSRFSLLWSTPTRF